MYITQVKQRLQLADAEITYRLKVLRGQRVSGTGAAQHQRKVLGRGTHADLRKRLSMNGRCEGVYASCSQRLSMFVCNTEVAWRSTSHSQNCSHFKGSCRHAVFETNFWEAPDPFHRHPQTNVGARVRCWCNCRCLCICQCPYFALPVALFLLPVRLAGAS